MGSDHGARERAATSGSRLLAAGKSAFYGK